MKWPRDNLMLMMREIDPTLTAAQRVVALTRVKILRLRANREASAPHRSRNRAEALA